MLQKSLAELDFKGILLGFLASLLLAVVIGSGSALFLTGLEVVTSARTQHPVWIWTLPLWGLLMVYAYQQVDQGVRNGNKTLVQSLHSPSSSFISWKMAPWILLSTWFTHLGGGSAGREGTAVQIGGSVADQLSRRFPDHRLFFLQAGIAAGFSSVFGTPMAGMFFAYELTKNRKISQLFAVAIASWGAHWVCSSWWGVAHTVYPDLSQSPTRWDVATIAYTALLALAIGGMARLFKLTAQGMKRMTDLISNPYVRVLAGGMGLACLFQWPLTAPFQGLGVDWIQKAFETPLPWFFGLAKLIFTLFTLSIGFKGGEATPLFFVGAMTGNVFSQFLPLDTPLAVGLGFVAQFGAVMATPWTALWMGLELFGPIPIHLLLLVAWGSNWVAGRRCIYEP